ncbi:myeloid-associated differentiation marker-like [Ctenodactylus gundi]
MPVAVTTTTTVTTATTVGSPQALTQPLGLLRLLQLLATCLALSLVASASAWAGPMGDWSMFSWCFCFAVTLLILLLELCGAQAHLPLNWRNFAITFAAYAALLCLSASVIYPTTYVQFLPYGRTRDHAIAATAFSCVACVAYALEVAWTRAKPGEVSGYMATVPGLLKVLETFVACLIFAFIGDSYLYKHKAALAWCVAVYAICFILAAVAVLLNLGDCTDVLPVSFRAFSSGLALLSVLMYATALVLWPLYQFDERYGGQSSRRKDASCALRYINNVCNWDRRLAVAILTAINLLAYVADQGHSAHLVFG